MDSFEGNFWLLVTTWRIEEEKNKEEKNGPGGMEPCIELQGSPGFEPPPQIIWEQPCRELLLLAPLQGIDSRG